MACLLSSVTQSPLIDLSLINSLHRPPTTGGKPYCYGGEINHVAWRATGPEWRLHTRREKVYPCPLHLEKKAGPSGPQAEDDPEDEEWL